MKFPTSHPQDRNLKIPIRKWFEKLRNRSDLKTFVEETKLVASDTGKVVELFKRNFFFSPKTTLWTKRSTANSWSGQDLPSNLVGKCTKFIVPPKVLAFFSAPCYHDLLPSYRAPSPASGANSPSSRGHHGWLPVQRWLPGLFDLVYLCPSQRFSPGQATVPWPPVCCQSKLAAVLAQGSSVLAAQVDTCCHFLVSELHLLTHQQVMVFGYNFGLESSLNIELFGYSLMVCLWRHTNNNKRWWCLHVFAPFWQKLHLVEDWTDCWSLLCCLSIPACIEHFFLSRKII